MTFTADLGKTVEQPFFHPYGRREASDRADIWFVTEDGGNLSECVDDAVGCLESQGLPFIERFRDPHRAFDALMTEHSTEPAPGTLGVHMPGRPDSPRWREVGLGIGHLIMDDPRTPMRTAPILHPD